MQATTELEERVYDDVDAMQGVYERSKDTSSENRPPQPSVYKTLLKQNVTNEYANIGQCDTAANMIVRNRAKDKYKTAKTVLLILCMFLLILLLLTALCTAIASIVNVEQYKGQLDSLTKDFNGYVLTNNHTNIIL